MPQKPRILVVDDNKATLRLFESTLKSRGAVPRCVTTSRQAALLVNREKFDGIFLNWESRELDGAELTRRIRRSKSNAKVPIAMVTARRDTQAIAEGFKSGVTFFLAKPLGAKELGRLLDASRGAMLEERRRYQRLPVTMPVLCAWNDKQVTGESIDLSASGLLLSISPRPAVGTEVALEFILPGSSLTLTGSVMRLGKGQQVGIKFTNLTRQKRGLLKTYLDRIKENLPRTG